jgi:aryl-alcohol dehydrogenase-like predicted oxidoreductase
MKIHPLPGTDLAVSRICFGVMRFNMVTRGDADFELYRQFREAGGNFFDTAHSYQAWAPNGVGASETCLGACIRRFGDRSNVVIVAKGGHPALADRYPRPDRFMAPEVIASDLSETLNRLQVDYVDVFMLHRDDVRHTVAEIIDALNAEIASGRARHIGASNWSTARLAEANGYAAARGLKGFVVSSPQWNLGLPNHPPVNPLGEHDLTCVQLGQDDVRWYEEHRLPLMPWTPTAYGYFAGRSEPKPMSFDNPVSWNRRERARKLAGELGFSANQVALAYLSSHPFPVFPIIGTTDPRHLAEDIAAADLTLTAEQVRWLRDG